MPTMVELIAQSAHPFQLSAFKDHIRLEGTDDDPAAQRSLDAAVTQVERWTGYVTRSTTVQQTEGYYAPPFRAAYGPVSNGTTTVTRYDPEENVTDDVSDSFWVSKCTGGTWLLPIPGKEIEKFKRQFTWQYTAAPLADIGDLQMAIFGFAALMFENREMASEMELHRVPIAYRTIIENYRRGEL